MCRTTATAAPPRSDSDARNLIVSGLVLFTPGAALVLVAIAVDLPVLFGLATILMLLGWSFPYLAIGKFSASPITTATFVLPVVLTFGLFYFQAGHEDHIRSGLGFDLDHTTHNLIGFVTLVLLEVVTIGLARKVVSANAEASHDEGSMHRGRMGTSDP